MSKERSYQLLIGLLLLLVLVRCDEGKVNQVGTSTYIKKKAFKKKHPNIRVKPKTKAVNIIETKTVYKDRIETFVSHDTVVVRDTIYIKPVYTSSIKNEWLNGSIIAKYDSISYNLEFKNKLIVTHEQKRGLFKQKPLVVKVKSENPHTHNRIISHHFVSKSKLISPSIQVGVGIDLIRKKPTVYAGLGLSVNL